MSGEVTYEEISDEEAWEIFDEAARRLLGISGDEFSRRLDGGEVDLGEDSRLMQLALLRPSGG